MRGITGGDPGPASCSTACQPFAVISINASDGGSPTQPKLLYSGGAAKFVLSARWPREGADKFVLTGGEENFTGRCERNNSEFSVYSAEQVFTGGRPSSRARWRRSRRPATARTWTASR